MEVKSSKQKKHINTDVCKLASPEAECNFCRESDNNELLFGKFYKLKRIHCHHFCLLLCNKLIQAGKDDEGILGFLYEDITRELKRTKKTKCYYCGWGKAALQCDNASCKKFFHLPCGRRNGALNMFFDRFQSYCKDHRPMQSVPVPIFTERSQSSVDKIIIPLERCDQKQPKNLVIKHNINSLQPVILDDEECSEFSYTCAICYDDIVPYPTAQSLWPECCRKDSWLHRICVEKLALSAGKYHTRCPLCNNQKIFLDMLYRYGIYIPDQDASWELENGAFQELLERPKKCFRKNCICPKGKTFCSPKNGPWKLLICGMCGSQAIHKQCHVNNGKRGIVCNRCLPSPNRERVDGVLENSPNTSWQLESEENEDIEIELSDEEEYIERKMRDHFKFEGIHHKTHHIENEKPRIFTDSPNSSFSLDHVSDSDIPENKAHSSKPESLSADLVLSRNLRDIEKKNNKKRVSFSDHVIEVFSDSVEKIKISPVKSKNKESDSKEYKKEKEIKAENKIVKGTQRHCLRSKDGKFVKKACIKKSRRENCRIDERVPNDQSCCSNADDVKTASCSIAQTLERIRFLNKCTKIKVHPKEVEHESNYSPNYCYEIKRIDDKIADLKHRQRNKVANKLKKITKNTTHKSEKTLSKLITKYKTDNSDECNIKQELSNSCNTWNATKSRNGVNVALKNGKFCIILDQKEFVTKAYIKTKLGVKEEPLPDHKLKKPKGSKKKKNKVFAKMEPSPMEPSIVLDKSMFKSSTVKRPVKSKLSPEKGQTDILSFFNVTSDSTKGSLTAQDAKIKNMKTNSPLDSKKYLLLETTNIKNYTKHGEISGSEKRKTNKRKRSHDHSKETKAKKRKKSKNLGKAIDQESINIKNNGNHSDIDNMALENVDSEDGIIYSLFP